MALLLWMCAAASLVVWGLRWLELGQYRPTQLAALDRGTPVVNAPSTGWRVLSTPAAAAVASAPSASGAWKLWGVVASEGGRGSALLAYAGEAPRTWRVGQSLDGQWRLQRVAKGRAWLVAAGGETSSPALELVLQTPTSQASLAPAAGPAPAAAPAPAGMPTPAAAIPARD